MLSINMLSTYMHIYIINSSQQYDEIYFNYPFLWRHRDNLPKFTWLVNGRVSIHTSSLPLTHALKCYPSMRLLCEFSVQRFPDAC